MDDRFAISPNGTAPPNTWRNSLRLTGWERSGDKSRVKLRSVILTAFACLGVFASDYTVRIETGERGLKNAIVRVPVPKEDKDFPAKGILQDASGQRLFFQTDPLGELAFVAPEIERHSVKRYRLLRAMPKNFEGMHADLEEERITVTDYGKRVFTYQGGEGALPRPDIDPVYKRGGYIHPVFSPGGHLVTDHYPPNHLHQHGIWAPWTKTEFEGRTPDFWNMGQRKGTVEFVKFGPRWSGGPVQAGFQMEHRFVDLTAPEPKVALNETWTVIAYHVPNAAYFVFDLVSTQQCAGASPLKLPKYHYGGLGFRGNWGWNGAKKTFFLTSNGETNRVKANETRGNWCHIGGEVDGFLTGVAILSHPGNFRSPQPMRVHPTEPFFCFAPSQLGDWLIDPGKAYVARYRFVVMDGPPDKAKIDQVWEAYAHPPEVAIEKD